MIIINNRLSNLRSRMTEKNMDAFLVTKPENIRYLSGFTGGNDARLFITGQNKYIISDSRYRQQIARESSDWELLEEKGFDGTKFNILADNFKTIGFESQAVSYDTYQSLAAKLKAKLIPSTGMIELNRIIKDEEELNLIRKAAKIGDEVFTEIITKIKPGISEKDIASQIAYLLRQKGCEKEAFDTIVVAGENAALPHGTPGQKIITDGNMVTMDFGGFYQGYLADMTRTVVAGKITTDFYDKYMAVLEAQELGVSLVKAGISCKDLDNAVRDRLQLFGLDQYFVHSTGHGVGLEVHEQPTVSQRSDTILMPDMVVTIEPGIYIKGWGGIRIEDTVIVKNDGCEVVTSSDKAILQI